MESKSNHAKLNVVAKEPVKKQKPQYTESKTGTDKEQSSTATTPSHQIKNSKVNQPKEILSQEKKEASNKSDKPKTIKKATPSNKVKATSKKGSVSSKKEYIQPEITYRPPEYSAKPKMISQIEPTDFTQKLLGIKKIRNGIIQTEDNRYIQILEIFPINFYKLVLKDQISVINSFYRMFSNSPRIGQFISITERTETKQFINHIQQSCTAQNDKKILAARDNIIRTIEEMAQYSIEYKFYYVYTYEGNVDGIRSSKFEDIYRSIKIKENAIREVFHGCGNLIASPENPDMATAEILYKFFNRGICDKESLTSRILRIQNDYTNYRNAVGKPINYSKINHVDYVAPKYAVVNHSDHIYMSGLYYTYMAICDDGYPAEVYPDWLNDLRGEDNNIDIHFFTDLQNHDAAVKSAERKRSWHKATLSDTTASSSSIDKAVKKYKRADNLLSYLKDEKHAEDLFDCLTVLVLYDRDSKNLLTRRDGLREKFKNRGIRVECCHNDVMEWVKMTMPFCNFRNSIFKRNKRNFLTHTLRHTYMYTKYTLADPNGIPMGLTDDLALFAYDRFNKRYFNNGNQFISGSSGSGKTYLLHGTGKRERLLGHKVYYIIPTKGYEFKMSVEATGGSYIKLGPGSPYILNIMELFPEQGFNIDMIDLSDEYDFEDSEKTVVETSVLINKVTSLCTWFSMLMDLEKNPYFRMTSMEKDRLNALLMRLYHDYGFSRDNDSIWSNKNRKIKKSMPTLSIWKQYMEEDGALQKYADVLLPFTDGTFSNFDGQTNVDLSKDEICFDVEVAEIGEEKHPVILYIAFDCAINLIKADPSTFGVIICDEVWQMMINEASGKQVRSTSKLIRGYSGGIIVATQEIKEMTDNEYGPAVINNTAIKTILSIEDDEFNRLQPVLGLLESERPLLTKNLANGQHYFMAKNIKIKYSFLTSLEERYLYESRKRDLKEILKAIRTRDKNIKEQGGKPWPHMYGIPY